MSSSGGILLKYGWLAAGVLMLGCLLFRLVSRRRTGHAPSRRSMLIELALVAAIIPILGVGSFSLLGGLRGLVNHTVDVPPADYAVYVPSGLQPNTKYPLVVLLSPSGDPSQLIERWKSIAERYKWILLGSRKFHNGASPLGVFKDITILVRENRLKLPIDPKRIISSGISGGAMGSHMFVYEQPDFISGIVANTGMIDKEYATYPNYPRGKFVVFLSSPTDFRYHDMQGDRRFLEGLGWKTKWIEFNGGHVIAPTSAYDEAAEWVSKQF